MSVDKKNLEDTVLVILIAIGLVGCSFFFFKDDGKPLSAFFAAFALSCIVYRFLGGIAQDTSFGMGFLKLGGSAAFIIGSIWFLNAQVFVADKDTVLSMPDGTRWYPVRMDTGNPDTVTIIKNSSVQKFHITERDFETLKNNEYILQPESGNRFQIKKNDITLGFATTSVKNELRQIYEPDIFTLYPYRVDSVFLERSKYPFRIVVRDGHFSILRNDNNKPACDECASREPVKKKHVFFEIDQQYYLCFVLQANHQIEQERWYSQYLVGRVDFKD